MANAHPCPSSPSVRSIGDGDIVEEDLGELLLAVHRLDRPDGDAGRVHVDEQRGDAFVRRLDVPVRVSRTHRCANCERLVQTFCPVTRHWSPSRAARQPSDARLLPVPGSENPWHQTSSPRSSGGSICGGQLGLANVMTDGPSTSGIE